MTLRKSLEEKIKNLEKMLLNMFDITAESLRNLVEITNKYDIESLARAEKRSDQLNWEIFEESLSTIATQQPAARDLRFVIMAPTISATHERINDLLLEVAISYSEIPEVSEWFKETIVNTVHILQKMLEVTREALTRRKFIDVPDKLTSLDDEIDKIFDRTIELLEKKKDIKTKTLIKIAYIMRDLERIGDLINKIGSRIVYIETGKMIPIK